MMDTNQSDAYEALVQFLYRAPIGLVQTGLDGTVDMLNPMSSNLLMPLARDGSLDNLFTVLHDVAPQLRAMTEAFDQPSGVVCEGLRVPLGGAAVEGGPQVLALSVLKLDGTRLMATVTDATADMRREQDRLARRLERQARTDALTRMPNREAMLEQLQQMLERPAAAGAGFALLFLNCDRFRQINDALGQDTGDALLVQIGERIRATLRPPSDRIDPHAGGGQMAARVGADEFAVVLDGLRARADAERVATRLLDALARPHALAGQDVTCKLSMGLVWSDDAGGNVGGAVRTQADDRLVHDEQLVFQQREAQFRLDVGAARGLLAHRRLERDPAGAAHALRFDHCDAGVAQHLAGAGTGVAAPHDAHAQLARDVLARQGMRARERVQQARGHAFGVGAGAQAI